MLANVKWMALRAAVLATVVLGTALAWTAGALAYDTGGTASTAAAVGESAVQDTVPPSAGRGSATGGVDAVVDMLPPDGTTGPATLQMMNDDDDFWNSGWWVVMVVMMLLFWGAIIALVVWGIRQFTGDRRRDRSALDIAKERLAGGEITKEEFDRIRSDLA